MDKEKKMMAVHQKLYYFFASDPVSIKDISELLNIDVLL